MLIAKILAIVALVSWLGVTGQRVLHAWQANDATDATLHAHKHSSGQVQLAGFYNRH